ncbi:BatA domain-containing protein [Candidatus Zixiibacteriota bacterium]
MNFLNSAILAALAAAAAPLLIHLLNRQKVRTIEFSSLVFLRNLQKTKMRRLKLRQVLLLVIRTLILVFLVLAFARPTMKTSMFSAVGSHAKTSVAFLADLSASMGLRTADGSALERATRRQLEVIELLKEGDQAIRGEFAHQAVFGRPTSDFNGLANDVREQAPGAGSTDIISTIARAEALLQESKNLNREIYVFSDLARNGFTAAAGLDRPTTENAGRIFLVDVNDSRAINAAVTAVEFSGELIQTNVPFEITARIVNRTEEIFDHLLVGVFLDGRRVAQDDVTLGSRGTAEVVFRLEIDQPGQHHGYVELADDDNLADNRCFFSVRIPQTTKVLLAADFPSARSFIRRALLPGGEGRLTVAECDTRDLTQENLAEYDAVFLASARRPEPVLWENVDRYLRSGGGVLVIPGADIDTAVYNSNALRRYFDLEFIAVPEEFPSTEQYFVLDELDWRHPILSVYRDVPTDKIPAAKFYSTFRVSRPRVVQSVLRFADGRPALIECQVGGGKLLLWTAPLDPLYSDISFHSLFVPLIGRTAEYLAADLGEQAHDYRVGQSVTRPRKALWRGPLVLQFPDGRSEQLGSEPSGAADSYITPELPVPGCYTLLNEDRPVDIFAVNIDAGETEIELIEIEEIERRLPGRAVTVLGSGDNLVDAILAARYGREIWKILLWVVVGLLLAETVLARTRKSELPPDMEHVA